MAEAAAIESHYAAKLLEQPLWIMWTAGQYGALVVLCSFGALPFELCGSGETLTWTELRKDAAGVTCPRRLPHRERDRCSIVSQSAEVKGLQKALLGHPTKRY